jgi:hypothetical protein
LKQRRVQEREWSQSATEDIQKAPVGKILISQLQELLSRHIYQQETAEQLSLRYKLPETQVQAILSHFNIYSMLK